MPDTVQPPAPTGLDPVSEHDPATGIRHTTESLLVLVTRRQDEHDSKLDRIEDLIEDLRRSSWAAVLREQLDRPIWPGRVELRLGTLLVLLAALVALFGSDRVAGWLPGWLSPSVAAP